jgi:hypothetical protein
MKLGDAVPAILIVAVVGIVLGIGIIVLDEMGDTQKASTSVANETVTTSSGTTTLANDDVTSIVMIQNSSGLERWFSGDGVSNVADGTVGATWNWTVAGVLTTNATDNVYNVSYVYDADTTIQGIVHSTRDSIDDFVVWIPIIVIIVATAIIMGIVLHSFRRP